MMRREVVARALYKAETSFDDWDSRARVTHSRFLCLADVAIEAIETFPPKPEPVLEEEDESDRVQDFYELNGLR